MTYEWVVVALFIISGIVLAFQVIKKSKGQLSFLIAAGIVVFTIFASVSYLSSKFS